MCGRFSLTTQEDQIERLFNVEVDRRMYVPRYNGAPTQKLAVITNAEPSRLSFYRWGLVPHWASDPRVGARMINARSETILEKPAFRAAFRSQRCLVPSDGFFEWKRIAGGKQPYRFVMKDGLPFAFAGIWEEWKDGEDRPLHTFSILTTAANALMAEVHDRMPVILPREAYMPYLHDEVNEAAALLKPFAEDAMMSYPVSSLVNSARNDSPEILLPAKTGNAELF